MIHSRLLLLPWATALVLTGCHGASSSRTPPPIDQRILLSTETWDLTSALPATPTLTFSVRGPTPERAADFAAVVAQEAYLLASPGGQRMAVRADLSALHPEISAGNDSAPPPAIGLRPEKPLSPGWYELHLGATAQQAQRSPEALTEFSPGDSGLRFRVGSGPVLASMNFCSPPDARPYVEVNFSEPMKLDPQTRAASDAVRLQDARGASLQCDELPQPAAGSSNMVPRVGRGEALRSWPLQCGTLPARVSVELSPHAVSPLGPQVQLSAPMLSRLNSIDIQSLPEDNGCKLLKL